MISFDFQIQFTFIEVFLMFLRKEMQRINGDSAERTKSTTKVDFQASQFNKIISDVDTQKNEVMVIMLQYEFGEIK